MSACEKCWRDANQRAFLLGGSVSDHYRALLDERRDNPCLQPEKFETDPIVARCRDCGGPYRKIGGCDSGCHDEGYG